MHSPQEHCLTYINKKTKARAHEQKADVSCCKGKGRILTLGPDASHFSDPENISSEEGYCSIKRVYSE